MAEATNKSGSTPPYMPYSTFRTFLSTLKVAIPARIDRSVMGSMSGGMQSWTLSTLRFFGFIDKDGQPTSQMEKYVHAEGDERKALLRKHIQACYPELFDSNVDLTKATMRQLEEKIYKGSIAVNTKKRIVMFFMSACKDADIELSPHLKARKAATGNRKPKRPKKPKVKPGVTPGVDDVVKTPAGMSTIPIALGPNKTWTVNIDKDHTPKDIKRFLNILGLVLGAES